MTNRREALSHSARLSALLAGIGLFPTAVCSQPGPYNAGAFEAKTINDALRAYGAGVPSEGGDITLTAPAIAENGAVVPVVLSTTLPNVKQLLIVVEKNPNVLAASFGISPAVDATLQTRIKMGESSNVYGVALTTDNRAIFARKEVKVTLGGCGI